MRNKWKNKQFNIKKNLKGKKTKIFKENKKKLKKIKKN